MVHSAISLEGLIHTYGADELDLDTSVLESLAILGTNSNSALDGLSIHKKRCLLATVLVELDIDHGPIISVFKHDVDVDGR